MKAPDGSVVVGVGEVTRRPWGRHFTYNTHSIMAIRCRACGDVDELVGSAS